MQTFIGLAAHGSFVVSLAHCTNSVTSGWRRCIFSHACLWLRYELGCYWRSSWLTSCSTMSILNLCGCDWGSCNTYPAVIHVQPSYLIMTFIRYGFHFLWWISNAAVGPLKPPLSQSPHSFPPPRASSSRWRFETDVWRHRHGASVRTPSRCACL